MGHCVGSHVPHLGAPRSALPIRHGVPSSLLLLNHSHSIHRNSATLLSLSLNLKMQLKQHEPNSKAGPVFRYSDIFSVTDTPEVSAGPEIKTLHQVTLRWAYPFPWASVLRVGPVTLFKSKGKAQYGNRPLSLTGNVLLGHLFFLPVIYLPDLSLENLSQNGTGFPLGVL